MGAAPNQDWIVLSIGYAVVAVGLLLFLWAIFGDRSRGRRRCPKCWYAMIGIAPVARDGRDEWQCPECGRIARNERQLHKTRRRWVLACASLLVVLAGYGTLSIPAIRRGGWVGVVPSFVLVLIAPPDERPPFQGRVRPPPTIGRDAAGNIVLNSPPPANPPSTPLAFQLCSEAWARFDQGGLAAWQARTLVQRFLAETKRSLAESVTAPPRWLAGRPLPLQLNHASTYRPMGGSIGNLEVIGAEVHRRSVHVDVPKVTDGVVLKLSLRNDFGLLVHSEVATLPVVVVAAPAEVFPQAPEPEATRLVQEALDIRIVHKGTDVAVVTDDRTDHPRWNVIDFGVGMHVEVHFDNEVVGQGKGDVNWKYPVFKDWHELVRMRWTHGGLQKVLGNPERAKFVVSGDPAEVFEQYARSPFDHVKPAAWRGRFETPVRVDSEWKRDRK